MVLFTINNFWRIRISWFSRFKILPYSAFDSDVDYMWFLVFVLTNRDCYDFVINECIGM